MSIHHYYRLLFLSFGLLFISSCKKDPDKSQPNPYIFANTSGIISKTAPIKVVFTGNMIDPNSVGGYVSAAAFSISPKVEGTALWQDEKTMVFQPLNGFDNDKEYVINVNIGELQDNVPSEFSDFAFKVRTIRQDAMLQQEGWDTPSPGDYRVQSYKGIIRLADYEDNKSVESILKVDIQGQSPVVMWQHDSKGLNHHFTITGIQRNEQPSKMTIMLDGKQIGLDKEEKSEIDIVPLSEFRVHDLYFNNDDDFYFTINFTDPVLPNQDLSGLITVEGYDNPVSYTIQNNNIKVYPSSRITGNHLVRVDPAVKNTQGKALGKPWSKNVNFMDTKPAVRFVNKGNIMPESDGLILPFEAINLNAIDVEIVKIYSNNILQYYQTYNGYEDAYEIDRVGSIILQQKIQLSDLNSSINKSNWVRYGLDLNKLITTDRNAIYQVRIGFRRAYTSYACKDNKGDWKEKELQPMNTGYGETVQSIYDNNYDGYAEEFSDDYNWTDYENPCKSQFYSKNHFVVQSVYKSNIGLIVKGNDRGDFFAATTDILTASPLSGATVSFYNYQQQKIAEGKTDGDGFLDIHLTSVPFIAIAEKDKDKSYLLIDDGRALSMSKFDVGGDFYQKGLKAYLYAERGVWRPGDSIFLNCILDDYAGSLPEKHPIQLEWRNPSNVLISKKIYNYSRGSIIPMHLATDSDAPTGVWSATVKAGGASFTKLFTVETIKPNKLKINLSPDKKQLMAGLPVVNASLNVAWLIGTVASNMRSIVEASVRAKSQPFEKYKDFVFSNQASAKSFDKTVYEGSTDNAGNASLHLNLNSNDDITQISNIILKTTVFEPGGNFSIDYTTAEYSPYKSYIGINIPKNSWGDATLPENKPSQIKVLMVNQYGKPISNAQVAITIYKVDWRWWWESDYNDASYYTGNNNSVVVKTFNVKTGADGIAKISFTPHGWGRYFINATSNESPHQSGAFAYVGYPDNADISDMAKIASALPMTTDKKEVTIGQPIQVMFNAPAGSKALITIENGNNIVKKQWHDCSEGQNKVSIKTTDEMGSNAYAFVTLIQPHKHPGNDLPIRMYGVVPFKIKNPSLTLTPLIQIPSEIQPDRKVECTVKEANGSEMYYTIAIVDEGLLDITKFKTPNPYDYFYGKSALAVKTWDFYDYILGAYSGQLANIFAVGGDMAAAQIEGAPKANRFVPAIVNLGPFKLQKGKTAHHSFTIKNYIGSVRAMVVATNGKASGSTEKVIKVVKPLMVSATLPRILRPGETFYVPVNVWATKDYIRNVAVSIKDMSGRVIPNHSDSQSVTFTSAGEKMVYFPVTVSQNEGVAKLEISATSGKESTKESVEIAISNPNLPITTSKNIVITAGKTSTLTNPVVGMSGTGESILEFSTFPSMNLAGNLDQLIDYPFGCLEQTISKAFPQLFLNDIVALSAANKDEIKQMVEFAIRKLASYQNSEGWYSFWPGGQYADGFTSIYAAHFLTEAKKAGYAVPALSYSSLINFEKKTARIWQPKQQAAGLYPHNADIDQAYRLFVLALAGNPEQGAMNQLKGFKSLSNQGKYFLAGAYAVIGKEDAAKSILNSADKSIIRYTEPGYTFGSDMRDRAILLNTYILINDKDNASNLAVEIAKSLGSQEWYATFSKAYGLWSVASYLKKYPPAKNIKAGYTINGKSYTVNQEGTTYYVKFDKKAAFSRAGITNKGKGTLYVNLIQKGKPSLTDQTAQANNISLTITYVDKKGQSINPAKLKIGTEFYSIATVKNTSQLGISITDLALTQIFPSSWEIVNDRLQEGMGVAASSNFEYQDIRDDRINTFFSLDQGETKIFRSKLIAAYAGKSYVPASSCSAMYDNTIAARVPGMWVVTE
ncbi:MAG: hypothetical protein J5I59_01965 [Saprospiraceae bacterium]|nr:hypothetical protein [Saprospiraceae bacterium]